MAELNTNAEIQASKATKLTTFKNIDIQSIKHNVAEMLTMIGRTNEIFSTYTKHDISHIDAMLKHIDWLIPPSTQKVLTPADWLLITLSIYFHDLGMLVTSEEFEKRMTNDYFVKFLEKLKTDPKSEDYLGRAKRMTDEQQERFFFQEYIRENHANRIKEWITGRHSHIWGGSVKPITELIADLMKPFPSRFRENLATVCESHHRDNLNKRDIYPLCQPYGSDSLEMANVQYAALILRTADLIHVTKDRTPSIMYKIINLSDPKGVEEWDKQKETFVVRHAGRHFLPEDQSTHIITVGADFTEERPFFALTEYLAWADGEIKQNKRWADQSQNEKDGKDFWYPWQAVQGDLRVEGNEPQQMRFEFDRGRLLDLLVGHAIYNDATVAIRELMQNAIDAVRFQHYLDEKQADAVGKNPPEIGKVIVKWHPQDRKLEIEDHGTGMDLDIIKFHLMRVGSSFYDTAQFSSEYKSFTPISRFGIGILTCFMVSDDIEIITFKNNHGYRIRMSSVHADYLLRDLPPGDVKLTGLEPHGTRITLIIREGEKLNEIKVEEILRYWVVLPACFVEYIEVGKIPVRIGFHSVVDALKSFYEKVDRQGYNINENLEIISKKKTIDGGNYEMAIALRTGWLPEKTFAELPLANHAAICIEGINVSETLPGWSYGKSQRYDFETDFIFGALISVQGVRGLRTTVSRSDLEEDEVYTKVGKICSELLFSHVEDELKRISSDKGKPLSRASTAGKWLCKDLIDSIGSKPVRDHVESLRTKLPFIVMEQNDANNTERRLVSPEMLMHIPYFWTIESRLVDSLGIISRDLGRELSLFEFLNALAPDYGDFKFSPILPDAQLFKYDVIDNYYPISVQFSRRFQQTAIKWAPNNGYSTNDLKYLLRDKAFSQNLQREYRNFYTKENYKFRIHDFNIGISELSGDEKEVLIVKTRIITIIAKETKIAKIWEIIQKSVRISVEQNNIEICIMLLLFRDIFYNLLADQSFSRDFQNTSASVTWNRYLMKINQFLKNYNIDELPENPNIIKQDMVFNASTYWRDWYRTQKKEK